MFIDRNTKVYFVLGSTDMRKGISRLALEVDSHEDFSVCDGSLFVFCSKDRKTIKVLFYEKNGFCLYQKKLEKEKFLWPSMNKQFVTLGLSELRWLLDGLNPVSTAGFKNFNFKSVI